MAFRQSWSHSDRSFLLLALPKLVSWCRHLTFSRSSGALGVSAPPGWEWCSSYVTVTYDVTEVHANAGAGPGGARAVDYDKLKP